MKFNAKVKEELEHFFINCWFGIILLFGIFFLVPDRWMIVICCPYEPYIRQNIGLAIVLLVIALLPFGIDRCFDYLKKRTK